VLFRSIAVLDADGGAMAALGLSADGKTLAAAKSDGEALVWRLAPTAIEKVEALPLERHWAALASEDATAAYVALVRLASTPEQCLPYVKERLQRGVDPVQQRIGRLIGDLESKEFAVREAAAKELEKLGAAAIPALRYQLRQMPSLELRRRIEMILGDREDRPEFFLTGEALRRTRCAILLERMATVEARQVLVELAKGLPWARETQLAKQALAR
jgi:hypothetical protein